MHVTLGPIKRSRFSNHCFSPRPDILFEVSKASLILPITVIIWRPLLRPSSKERLENFTQFVSSPVEGKQHAHCSWWIEIKKFSTMWEGWGPCLSEAEISCLVHTVGTSSLMLVVILVLTSTDGSRMLSWAHTSDIKAVWNNEIGTDCWW